jgi:hypothetical protein
MNDLLTRLRAYNPHDATARALMDEAAAEIERLRGEVDALYLACYRQLDPTRTIRDRHMELIALLEQMDQARAAREG